MQSAGVLHGLRWLPEAWLAPDAVIHLAISNDDTKRERAGIKRNRRRLDVKRLLIWGEVVSQNHRKRQDRA